MSFKDIDFENDCIGWVCHCDEEMRNSYIKDGFYSTAKLIYEALKSNYPSIFEDNLVYPFLHTIRHTYELSLKMIMYNINEFYLTYRPDCNTFDKDTYTKLRYSHNIGKIYIFIKNNIYCLDSRLELEIKESVENIGVCIDDFIPEKELDPYRYATTKDGKETLEKLERVSFDKAFNSLEKFKQSVDFILLQISLLFDEYKLGTYYKRVNRIDIIKIAYFLPDYQDWHKESFTTIMKKIEKKYSLSKNDFLKILKIIKDSRFLSYFINFNRKNYSNLASKIFDVFEYNIEINIKRKMDNCESPTSDIFENLCKVQDEYSKYKLLIKKFTDDELLLIYVYYKMGSQRSFPEQFDSKYKEFKDLQLGQNNEGFKFYLREKFNNTLFIYKVLTGVYSSGDYELFIELYKNLSEKYPFNDNIDELKEKYELLVDKKEMLLD